MTGVPVAQAVLDALTSHVAVIDVDGQIVAVNRAWDAFAQANGAVDLIGTSVGANYLEVLRGASGACADEARSSLAGILEIMAGARSAFTLEYPCFSPTEPRWFSMHASPLDHQGVVVSHTDITERKLAEMGVEEALRREAAARSQTEAAQRILTTVVERVPIGIILVNPAGELLLLNEAGRRVIGILQPEHLATIHNIGEWSVLDPETREPMPAKTQPLRRALAGETVASCEFVIERLDGAGQVRVLESASPLFEPNGEVAGAVAVFGDVTKEREIEKQRENFISNAAHDLKGPLTTIKGFAQLLHRQLRSQGELSAERATEPLRQIDLTATRLATQIDELQDLSSIRTGKPLRLTITSTRASDLLRRLVAQYQESMEGYAFHLDLPEYDIEAEWDASRMERVLQNLLSNAVKYSPEGTSIDVALRIDGDKVVIAVSDRGIGIPTSDLPHVFERYFRGSNVTEREGGTGIGLTGVRQIVIQHGGEVLVESRDGGGSVFTIRLPIQARDHAPDF